MLTFMNSHQPKSAGTLASRCLHRLPVLLLLGLFFFFTHPSVRAAQIAPTILESGRLDYKVGFLGNPSSSIPFEMTVPVPWTTETIGQLKELGFNTIQINVAWGPRPADEVPARRGGDTADRIRCLGL